MGVECATFEELEVFIYEFGHSATHICMKSRRKISVEEMICYLDFLTSK